MSYGPSALSFDNPNGLTLILTMYSITYLDYPNDNCRY